MSDAMLSTFSAARISEEGEPFFEGLFRFAEPQPVERLDAIKQAWDDVPWEQRGQFGDWICKSNPDITEAKCGFLFLHDG